MTMRKKMMKGLFVAALLIMMGFSGCIWGQKAVVVGKGPTCEETLSTGVNGFSDYEVAALLDKALADDRKAECWTPIMEICLNENREIPRRHLAEAVKTFNKRRYEPIICLSPFLLSFLCLSLRKWSSSPRYMFAKSCLVRFPIGIPLPGLPCGTGWSIITKRSSITRLSLILRACVKAVP